MLPLQIYIDESSKCVESKFFYSHSDYLQQESKDKKGKEMDTSGWTLHSKKRNVSYIHLPLTRVFLLLTFIFFGKLLLL